MQFLSEVRDRIRRGEIICSVRLWQRSHVKVGGRYPLPPGHIVVTSVTEMSLEDITAALARRSGFMGVVDLLKTAKHGPGRRVFLIEFRYEAPGRPAASLRPSQRLMNQVLRFPGSVKRDPAIETWMHDHAGTWVSSPGAGSRSCAAVETMFESSCTMAIRRRVSVTQHSPTSMPSRRMSMSDSFVEPSLEIPRASWRVPASSCAT